MRIEKGNLGYIKDRKKVSVFWLILCILVGVAIFVAGYYLNNKTRANVFTVVAILMVLPAAKRVIALIVLLRKKGTSKERFDAICQAAPEALVKADYVFTSTDKIMHLDILVIRNGFVLGVIAPSRQDVRYLKKYIAECANKAGGYKAKLFKNDEELIRFLKKSEASEQNPERDEKVWTYLSTLSV